jgi:hypothetical protein
MMGQERSYLSRWCKNCGIKLRSVNVNRTYRGWKVRNLCQFCYNNPSDEERCKATTVKGKRCKHRKDPDSKLDYCGMHDKKAKV